MNAYEQLRVLHENESIHVKTFEATLKDGGGEFLVKQYLSFTAEEADALLKESIAQAHQPFPIYMALSQVALEWNTAMTEIMVNFIFKKRVAQLPIEVVMKNDRSGRYDIGLSGYDIGELMYEQASTYVKVFKGRSKSKQIEVVVKSYDNVMNSDLSIR